MPHHDLWSCAAATLSSCNSMEAVISQLRFLSSDLLVGYSFKNQEHGGMETGFYNIHNLLTIGFCPYAHNKQHTNKHSMAK